MRKVYLKEWVKYHPYKKTDEVDRYYCELVNRINKRLWTFNVLEGEDIVDEGIYEETAMFIAAWFEDIISQTGIWQVFTSQCLKRYGSRLPFYEIGDYYYADEINLEDLRFIIWHCFQRKNIGIKVYNPENQGIELLALDIYSILDNEYETAPENERLIDFFDFSSLNEGNFQEYRNKLEWFYFNCYINQGVLESYIESMSDEMDRLDNDENMDPATADIMLYSHRINKVLNGRTPLLAITAAEYLKLILEADGGSADAPYMNIDSRKENFYLVTDEADDYYVFKELTDDENEYKVVKNSLQLGYRELVPGDTIVTSSLFRYGSYWCHNGAMMNYGIGENPGIIEQIKENFSRYNQKEAYNRFISSTGGKHFVFVKGTKGFDDFMSEKVGYRNAPGVNTPDLGDDVVMITATEENGLCILHNFCDCISSPDNMYYNKENAEKYAIYILTDRNSVPYEICCRLLDNGYLKDAGLRSTKGEEYGRKFVKDNALFIADYFFNCCREKDFRI